MMGKRVAYKSRHGMSAIEGAVHAFLIVGTCGFWYPVYRLRRHAVDRTTTTYEARRP